MATSSERDAAPVRWPDLAGRIEGRVHRLPVRVYYEDTDFSGYVYHANYVKFCERGRSDCLRLLGVHHHELVGTGGHDWTGFVVRRMEADFLKPARIDEVLEVHTSLAALGRARIVLDQRILRGEDCLFTALVTAAVVDRRGRPVRLSAGMTAALECMHPDGPGVDGEG